MKTPEYQEIGLAFLRISLGLLFFIAGITKLIDPSGIINMTSDLGFPSPFDTYFGMLTMLAEIVFGATVLIRFNVKFSTIPLIIITIVAAIGVHGPNIEEGAMIIVIILLHLVTIAALIYIRFAGPGPYAIKQNW